MTIYQAAWVFFIYSFIGWCCEVIYAAICLRRFVNRGFLNGPVCPIYGAGVVVVAGLLAPLQYSIPLLFIGATLLTSALELATGFIMEKFFGQKLWDYSDRKFNIMGYITLEFSFIWGAGCVLIIKLFQPLVMRFINWMPEAPGISLLIVFSATLAADIIVTVSGVVHMKRRIISIGEAAANLKALSDRIGEALSEGAIEIMERIEEMRGDLESGRERYHELFSQGGYVQNRLQGAFPNLRKRFESLAEAIGKEGKDGPKNDK